ncbi:MAG: hypothetical protein AAFQ13_06070 [Pseudomonadota bacterium]
MPTGEISSGRYSKRHPLDWYVDPIWCARQLALALDRFAAERRDGLAIWDPCCGMGNTLQAAWELADEGKSFALSTIGSDLVDNFDWATFDACPDLERPAWFRADFLERKRAPEPCSIVCNPPYSYIKNIAELFARHALKLAAKHVCILMPTKWLSSQARQRLFTEHPPLAILYLSQRPSMPPGDRIIDMGSRAFSGGMVDYCWIVWDVTKTVRVGATRAIWLPPLAQNSEIKPLWEMCDA